MRTLTQNLRLNKEQFKKLFTYSKWSNELYNYCIEEIKNYYEGTGKYIGLKILDKKMQEKQPYKDLPSFNAQQIVRLADKNYRAFFALLRKKLRGEYADEVNPPQKRKNNSLFILIFDNTRVYVKNNQLKLYKDLKIPFTYEIGKIKQAIIKWTGCNFKIFITYHNEVKEKKENNGKYLAIDFGVNNLASCVSNVGQAFIINGRPLKSINQFYNKQKARIQAELQRKNNKKSSKRLAAIAQKRRRRIEHYFYSAVSLIVKKCEELKINTIILGYNPEWKEFINLGKKNNQNFQHIPYASFRNKLASKCEELGIHFIITEESYTSKTSFLDGELPQELPTYKGRRVKRGLFRSSDGALVNADCNGAAQILSKKVSLNRSDRDKVEAVIVTPVRISL